MKLKSTLMKDARDRKGLTLKELAEASKISAPTLARAENGEDISPTTGRRLCEFLDVDLAIAVVPRHPEGNGDAA